MKLTSAKLRQIIREEVKSTLTEAPEQGTFGVSRRQAKINGLKEAEKHVKAALKFITSAASASGVWDLESTDLSNIQRQLNMSAETIRILMTRISTR